MRQPQPTINNSTNLEQSWLKSTAKATLHLALVTAVTLHLEKRGIALLKELKNCTIDKTVWRCIAILTKPIIERLSFVEDVCHFESFMGFELSPVEIFYLEQPL